MFGLESWERKPSTHANLCTHTRVRFMLRSPARPGPSGTPSFSGSPRARSSAHNQPLVLHLIDIEPMLPVLGGVMLELEDCASPVLREGDRDRRSGGGIPRGGLGAADRQRAAQAGHGTEGFAGDQWKDFHRAGPGLAEARGQGCRASSWWAIPATPTA